MVAFGFMDNTIMIHAGELIDEHVGAILGLTTMASAAAGQVCSDTCGVMFGGCVESVLAGMGLAYPAFTGSQRSSRVVKLTGVAGAALGVFSGCAVGMVNLLFLDLKKVERQKKQAELKCLFAAFAEDGPGQFEADRCTLYLKKRESSSLWTMGRKWKLSDRELDEALEHTADSVVGWSLSRVVGESQAMQILADGKREPRDEFVARLDAIWARPWRREIGRGGTKHMAIEQNMLVNISDTKPDPRFKPVTKRHVSPVTSIMVCPVTSQRDGCVIGVVEVVNKLPTAAGDQGKFDNADEKLIRMLCGHVSKIIDTCCEDDELVLEFPPEAA